MIFDQNLSPDLPSLLKDLFPDSLHVIDLDLDAADDGTIWNFASRHGYDIVTKDKDYEELSKQRGHPPRVIKITSGNGPTSLVANLFRERRLEISTFENDPLRGLLRLP